MVNWNNFTNPDDIVIIAGDIGHYCPRTVDVLKKLNGTKILVIGNHDIIWGNNLYTCGCFQGIHTVIDTKDLYVEHIPEHLQGIKKYHIHGHHHRYDMPGMQHTLKLYAADPYRLNCAADLNNNRPCTLQELILNKEVMLDKFQEIGLL
jgi:calcineurin-like phosphoesterase family protein